MTNRPERDEAIEKAARRLSEYLTDPVRFAGPAVLEHRRMALRDALALPPPAPVAASEVEQAVAAGVLAGHQDASNRASDCCRPLIAAAKLAKVTAQALASLPTPAPAVEPSERERALKEWADAFVEPATRILDALDERYEDEDFMNLSRDDARESLRQLGCLLDAHSAPLAAHPPVGNERDAFVAVIDGQASALASLREKVADFIAYPVERMSRDARRARAAMERELVGFTTPALRMSRAAHPPAKEASEVGALAARLRYEAGPAPTQEDHDLVLAGLRGVAPEVVGLDRYATRHRTLTAAADRLSRPAPASAPLAEHTCCRDTSCCGCPACVACKACSVLRAARAKAGGAR